MKGQVFGVWTGAASAPAAPIRLKTRPPLGKHALILKLQGTIECPSSPSWRLRGKVYPLPRLRWRRGLRGSRFHVRLDERASATQSHEARCVPHTCPRRYCKDRRQLRERLFGKHPLYSITMHTAACNGGKVHMQECGRHLFRHKIKIQRSDSHDPPTHFQASLNP